MSCILCCFFLKKRTCVVVAQSIGLVKHHRKLLPQPQGCSAPGPPNSDRGGGSTTLPVEGDFHVQNNPRGVIFFPGLMIHELPN